MSRLVFLLEDLRAELGTLAPGIREPHLALDPETHRAVISDLQNHFGCDMTGGQTIIAGIEIRCQTSPNPPNPTSSQPSKPHLNGTPS